MIIIAGACSKREIVMKKMKKKAFSVLSLLLAVFMALPVPVAAASAASFSLKGNTSVAKNATFSIEVVASATKTMNAAEGTVSIADTDCVEILSMEGLNVSSISGHKYMYANIFGGGITSATSIAKINLKAKDKVCTTTLSVAGVVGGFTDNTDFDNGTLTQTIQVGSGSTPALSSDATLKGLRPSTGSLSPSFSSGTTSYNMQVGKDATTVSFTATPNDSGASIKSGSTCTLTGETTACRIVVKAANGTEKTYTVQVKKTNDSTPDTPTGDEKSSDATLKSLDMSGFILTPRFNPNVDYYEIKVQNQVDGLKVTAIPNDEKATVKVIGNLGWEAGKKNPVRIIVTAEDGSQKTYTVNVERKTAGDTTNSGTQKSSDNHLKSLSVGQGTLSPSFDKDVHNYNITVPNEITKLDLSAITNHSGAKTNITGNSNFQVGMNVVNIEVTAEDGSLRIYTINVTRSSKSSENELGTLTLGGGATLSPAFDPDVYEYDVTVPSGVDKLDITAKASNSKSKVEIIGNEDLKEGKTPVLVKVTDENGFVQYYHLNVTKEGPKKFLGFTLGQWLLLFGILLLSGLFIWILFLLLHKDDDEEEEPAPVIPPQPQPTPQTPIIEFKPEFNFGSKNGTDDDQVAPGGVLNQYVVGPQKEEHKVVDEIPYQEAEPAKVEEIAYNPYDEVVTKDELYDALAEALETKDVRKLKMLYDQEQLNRRKEELRKLEEQDKDQ